MPLPAEPPREQNWRTTDEQEVARRRQRAVEERPPVRNADPRHPVFSNFAVRSPSGLEYSVEVRDIMWRTFHCTCADFRVNGLGTCKHIEAVLLHLEQKAPLELAAARAARPSRADLLPDPARGGLRVEGAAEKAPRPLRRLFDTGLGLRPGHAPELVVQAWRQAAAREPALRVSQETDAWLESRRRAAEAVQLRREYEQKVHSGEWPPHETRAPLYPFQREGMLHLACRERALLADEMGLGKTVQAIAACALLHRIGRARRAVIVAPATRLPEWEQHIARLTRLPYAVADGTRQKRAALYGLGDDGPVFTLLTYEQAAADYVDLNEALKPDVVILDEAQRVKSWSSRLALAVKRLRSRYAFVLTPTPLENELDELYSLVSFLDPAVLGPLFRFNREFYDLDRHGRPVGVRNLDRLRARVAPVILRRRKDDVAAQLPSRADRWIYVPLSDEQRKAYDPLAREAGELERLARAKPPTEEQRARLLRVLSLMRMVCDTNFILNPDERACPKLGEISRLLRDATAAPGVKVLVFSEWERMLELVRGACEKLRLGFAWHTGALGAGERRVAAEKFREDPECRVFLSTDTNSPGLSLENATVVIHCDLPWNPARLDQRNARAWRPGQDRPVTVLHLVSEHTIEHRLMHTLERKRSLADAVLLDEPATPGGRAAVAAERAGPLFETAPRVPAAGRRGDFHLEQTDAAGRVLSRAERTAPPPRAAARSAARAPSEGDLLARAGDLLRPLAPRFPANGPPPLFTPAGGTHGGPGRASVGRRAAELPPDRAAEFTRAAVAAIGEDLRAVEERQPAAHLAGAEGAWMLCVVGGDVAAARGKLHGLYTSVFGPDEGRLVVMDLAAAAEMRKMSAAGLVSAAHGSSRQLHPPAQAVSGEKARKLFAQMKSRVLEG